MDQLGYSTFQNKQSNCLISANVPSLVYLSKLWSKFSCFLYCIFKNIYQNKHLSYYLTNWTQMDETNRKYTGFICAFEK